MIRLATPSAEPDHGLTVAEAARIIGCDPTTVRQLVRIGQLEGWRVGKTRRPTGVRVSAGSCLDYRARHAIAPVDPHQEPPQRPRARRDSAVLAETIASLRRMGVRV